MRKKKEAHFLVPRATVCAETEHMKFVSRLLPEGEVCIPPSRISHFREGRGSKRAISGVPTY